MEKNNFLDIDIVKHLNLEELSKKYRLYGLNQESEYNGTALESIEKITPEKTESVIYRKKIYKDKEGNTRANISAIAFVPKNYSARDETEIDFSKL
jgi:hypothetical protein